MSQRTRVGAVRKRVRLEHKNGSEPVARKTPRRLFSLKRPWNEYLTKMGLHASASRDLIVDTFLGTEGHVDLTELFARVRLQKPGIGLATVYRTVKLMQDAGVAEARRFSPRGTVYEVAVGRAHHDHLICEVCGDIIEFSDPQIERIQAEVARSLGFELLHHRHELFGRCAACQLPAATRRR